ncbi:L,D-transpeptidase [Methylopila henanensis]|uniref:L,D-transpeptidase n=1 Tax=Methylopila henanensis TaxID=873516 RepID=A0ABW4K5J1_9HYPH
MTAFRAPLAAMLGALTIAALAPAAPAVAQSRVIETREYAPRAGAGYYYDDEPRVVRRAPSRNMGGGLIEEMFGDDEPVYRTRRIPTSRERQAERRSGRMALDGGEARVYRYGDEPRVLYGREYRRYDYDDRYDDPYEMREPRIERTPRRLAGPPSAAGAGDAARRTVDPKFARTTVQYAGSEPAGSIVINTRERFLYLVQGDGTAIRYGVGVGKEGFSWKGTETISQKREWPDWRPPAEMRQRRPELPAFMPGGPDNPLGARALYLGSTLYRIHGSNEPWSIGRAVSSGCIRMTNEDVTDLYERVRVGTVVKVI